MLLKRWISQQGVGHGDARGGSAMRLSQLLVPYWKGDNSGLWEVWSGCLFSSSYRNTGCGNPVLMAVHLNHRKTPLTGGVRRRESPSGCTWHPHLG